MEHQLIPFSVADSRFALAHLAATDDPVGRVGDYIPVYPGDKQAPFDKHPQKKKPPPESGKPDEIPHEKRPDPDHRIDEYV